MSRDVVNSEQAETANCQQFAVRHSKVFVATPEHPKLTFWKRAGLKAPERRDRSLFQARLLAGALWEASAVLIDQLFEDLEHLRDLDRVDRQDIANTFRPVWTAT